MYRQFDKKVFGSVNPLDPASIFETGAKMAFSMLAMSFYGKKLRNDGNWNLAESSTGQRRRNKIKKKHTKALEGKREGGHKCLRMFN